MYLTEYETGVYEWLKTLGIQEKFPYVENGVEGLADNIEEIFFKAIHSYDTFHPLDKKYKPYSKNDLRNISLIQEYQRSMQAYYAPFQTKRTTLTEKDIAGFPHVKVKDKLRKANEVNRGIYFVSALQGYTSTTIYDNPVEVISMETKRPHKERVFGRIQKVLPETLRLFDGTIATFDFPFVLNGVEDKRDSIYEVYEIAYNNPNHFEIIADNGFYSGQQKRIINRLMKIGGN